MTSTTAALLHSSTALAAVRAERDAILDIAELLAESHPAMSTDDLIALATESHFNA